MANRKLGRSKEQAVDSFAPIPNILENSGLRLTMNLKEVEVLRKDGARVKLTVAIPDIIQNPSTGPSEPGQSSACTIRDHVPSDPSIASSSTSSRTNPPILTCFNCPKTFSSRNLLKRHQEIHQGNFQCPFQRCGSTYRNQTTLTKHCVKQHGLQLPRSMRSSSKTTPKSMSSASPSTHEVKEEVQDEDAPVDHTLHPELDPESGSYDLYSESSNQATATSSNSNGVEFAVDPVPFLDVQVFEEGSFPLEEPFENWLGNVEADEFP